MIPESNIESYFVWIPRYKYKIFNTGNYSSLTTAVNNTQTIEIQFEDKTTTPSKGTTVGSWLSHPTFQAFDSDGFWVGKFESGYKGATNAPQAEINSSDYTKLQIKPNVYSWRNITLGNAFKVSYDYARNLESHMMKNTEWGAVAYLSHSKYGKNGEVYLNNDNTNAKTSCGRNIAYANNSPICLNSFGSREDNVYNQTTTGNISGILDMAGGSQEFVIGYNTKATKIGGNSGITNHYSNFFTNSLFNKYYDRYNSNSESSYNNRILGDATGELGPFEDNIDGKIGSWYKKYSYFVNAGNPWFRRGGRCAAPEYSGIFFFKSTTGDIDNSYISFRIILSI